ncbi:MAG TPA: NAD-dependent epimerase/dehydratase family protein [bacterium]|nr:NAD-dependent epimerase/dehydratase family protein [bacterium]
MKVLVTGGAGFIGSHTVDKLIEEGNNVFIIDNLSTGNKQNINKKAKFFNIDIRDKKISDIFKEERFDAIFHFAAQINVRKSVEEPFFDIDVNINGTLNIITNFLKYGKGRKFIFSSTGGAIYGDTKTIPTSEKIIPFPLCPYGISKLGVEKFLHYYSYFNNLEYVALRYGNVYGPRQNPYSEAGVIAIFIGKILKEEICTIYGDGNQTRDFVFIEDVVKANLMCFKKNVKGVFNVGTNKETSVNKIFNCLKKISGKNIKAIYKDEKTGDIKRSCLKIDKIIKKVGWEPDIMIEKGIEKTYKWFKGNFEQ